MSNDTARKYLASAVARPLRIYVAGPYRASTPDRVAWNIEQARLAGRALRRMGFHVFIPHCNSAHEDGQAPDSHFLAEGLDFLRLCDAVVLLPGWEASEGARAEVAEAQRLDMPVMVMGEVA
jgi:hypothetical protein